MKTARLTCGCRHEVGDRERIVELCPAHRAEFSETHARWARERHARVISGTGSNSERRELAAFCRGLKVTP